MRLNRVHRNVVDQTLERNLAILEDRVPKIGHPTTMVPVGTGAQTRASGRHSICGMADLAADSSRPISLSPTRFNV